MSNIIIVQDTPHNKPKATTIVQPLSTQSCCDDVIHPGPGGGGNPGGGGTQYHNELQNIQGGTPNERYHLTKRLYDALQNIAATASNKFATVSDLEDASGGLGPALATLTNFVNTNITQLKAKDVLLTADIATLTSNLADAVTSIQANITAINGLRLRIVALENGGGGGGDTTYLQQQIDGLRSDVNTNISNITSAKNDITTLKTDVSNAKVDILTLKANVLTLQTDLATTISTLNLLDAKLTTINGPGLIFNNGKLTLDLASTTLVNPTITPTWTLVKNDNTAYTPSTSTSKNISVDKGVKATLSAVYRYPSAGAGQGLPTSVSGNFGTVLPAANTNSNILTVNNISTSATYSVTLAKPKSGLVVVNNQVTFPTGSDTTTDNTSITFLDRSYLGYSASSILTPSEIVALANSALVSSKARTVTGVTAGAELYTYYVYPAALGDLTSIIMDGAAPVLGAFTKLADVTATNPGGISVAMRIYKSNATQAFNNNNLAFS